MKSFSELVSASADEAKAELLSRAQEAYDLAMNRTSKNKKGESVPNPDIASAMFVLNYVSRVLGVETSKARVSRKTVTDLAANAPWMQRKEPNGGG